METKHIKLDYEDALSGKKQLLSMELNLLYTSKRVRNYKLLRKKEAILRGALKTNLRELKTKMNFLKSTFPEEEEHSSIKIIKKSIEKRKQQDIKNQLDEIQKKLSKLQ